MIRRFNLKEKIDGYYSEEILNDLRNDLYNAVSEVMFKYRYYDIPRETLDDIISKNMERFYDKR